MPEDIISVDKGQLVITQPAQEKARLYKGQVERRVQMIENRIAGLQEQITQLTARKTVFENSLQTLDSKEIVK